MKAGARRRGFRQRHTYGAPGNAGKGRSTKRVTQPRTVGNTMGRRESAFMAGCNNNWMTAPARRDGLNVQSRAQNDDRWVEYDGRWVEHDGRRAERKKRLPPPKHT